MLADCVEDDVVRLAVSGEVFLRVVEDPVGSERFHQFEVLRVAHRSDVTAEVVSQLHPGRADGPGRAVDEDHLAFLRICLSQAPEGVESTVANCRGLLKAQTYRYVGNPGALRYTDELRVGPEPKPR